MRALLCLVAATLSCAAADLHQLEPLIDRLRANPENRRAVLRAINGVLRPWLDEVIAPHGYSPGPATIASKLNAELVTVLGAERVCGSERTPGCIGRVHIVDLREPYFMIVRTGVWLPCGFEEAAYLYEWSNARWTRRLAIDEEPTPSGPPRRFPHFDLSPADGAGRRVLASAALLRHCDDPRTAIAEMRVYTFDDRVTRQVVFDKRLVLPDEDPIAVRAERSLVSFELTADSIGREREIRRAVHSYELTSEGARRIQPVARTVRSFVEEWLTTPWREARAWSAREPRVAEAHAALSADQISGEFVATAGCEVPRTFEVGMENVDLRTGDSVRHVPEVYFKVQATGPDTYLVFGVSTEPDDSCE